MPDSGIPWLNLFALQPTQEFMIVSAHNDVELRERCERNAKDGWQRKDGLYFLAGFPTCVMLRPRKEANA